MPQVFMMKSCIYENMEFDMNGYIQMNMEFRFGNTKRLIAYGKRWLKCMKPENTMYERRDYYEN